MKQYDVNKDGKVNQEDVTIVQQYVAKLITFDAYDIDGDGDIDLADYLEWRRHFDLSDIDKNGVLSENDVNEIKKAVANLTKKKTSMDLNNDNKINMEDVCKLQQLLDRTSALHKKLDLTDNGIITSADGIILRQLIDICRSELKNMDVNKDGKVNIADANCIKQNLD